MIVSSDTIRAQLAAIWPRLDFIVLSDPEWWAPETADVAAFLVTEPDPPFVPHLYECEVWRGGINRVFIHPNNAAWIVAEAHIPASDGGFDIREAGVFDAAGALIAVGKYPLTTKPTPGSGSEKELYVRLVMAVTNAADVQLTIDPNVVTVTMQDLAAHEAKQLDPSDTNTTKDKHLSNAQAHGCGYNRIAS